MGFLGADGAHGNVLVEISCHAGPEEYFSCLLLRLVSAQIAGVDLHDHLGAKGFWGQDFLTLENDVVGDRQFVPEVPELRDSWLAILSLLWPALVDCRLKESAAVDLLRWTVAAAVSSGH